MWGLLTYQEVSDMSIRAARGIPDGGALNSLPGASDFGAPHPGAFPTATLPSRPVAPGDNLWSIAAGQYGSGLYYPDIAGRDHVPNPDLIHPGQHLTLPPVDPDHLSPPPPAPAVAAPHSGSGYGVQRDDSLWSIARRAYGDGSRWRDIALANHLHGTTIQRGERLWIPPLGQAAG